VVGDFVLKRADGIWSYQLAVVVDDAEQGVTDIVRGEDLLSSTARQQLLARLLGLSLPRVLHVPVIYDARGLKLSKQNGAQAIELSNPLGVLQQAWQALGFEKLEVSNIETFWSLATQIWGQGPERANLHGIHHHSYDAR
jgi:glutamyl-Q tRNA(Asp) synthetase